MQSPVWRNQAFVFLLYPPSAAASSSFFSPIYFHVDFLGMHSAYACRSHAAHYMIVRRHRGQSMIPKVQFPAPKAIIDKALFPFTRSSYSVLKRHLSSTCTLAIVIPLICGPVASKTADPVPVQEDLSAQAIVDRAVDRTEAQHLSMVEASFKSEAVAKTQSLDGNNNITDTETSRYRQYPLNGAVFEELIEINGRPLNEKEIQKEETKKREFIQEVEQRRTRGDYIQPVKEERIRFNREFTERYLYNIEKTEMIRGHLCWVISLKPREGKLPERNRMDRALNQMTGTLWVSQDDYGLVRVEFGLSKPFNYWGGFLAVIRKTDGWVEYTRVESNVWLPRHFNLQLDLKVMMFKNIRRLIIKEWSDYSRVDPDSAPNRFAGDSHAFPTSNEENP